MNWIAISFITYTLLVMGFGIYSVRFSKNTSSDFFLADRGLNPWIAALSSSASAESGWVTLGLVGVAYKTGIGVFWLVLGTVVAFLFNWLVIARKLRDYSAEHDAITITDILAAQRSTSAAKVIRIISVLIILLMLTAYVAAQLNAAGKAFQEAFECTYFWGVIMGAGIVLIYTIVGGFRAVAWTDVAQATLMIAGVIILPIVMIIKIGGPAEFWHQLQLLDAREIVVAGKTIALSGGETMTSPFAMKSGLALIGFLSVWLGVPLGNPGQPHVLVRLMAINDTRAVRRAATISSIWVFFLFSGAILVGLTARVLFEGAMIDPERALPYSAVQLLPAPLAGMMIAALVAAMCSTADSQLLLSASAVSHDIWAKLLGKAPSDYQATLMNRGAVTIIAVIATSIAVTEVRVVFDFVLYAWDSLGASFGPALILTLLWKRTTGWGVACGMVVGVGTAIVWRETLHAQFYSLIPAFALAFFTIVVVSLLSNQDESSEQQRSLS